LPYLLELVIVLKPPLILGFFLLDLKWELFGVCVFRCLVTLFTNHSWFSSEVVELHVQLSSIFNQECWHLEAVCVESWICSIYIKVKWFLRVIWVDFVLVERVPIWLLFLARFRFFSVILGLFGVLAVSCNRLIRFNARHFFRVKSTGLFAFTSGCLLIDANHLIWRNSIQVYFAEVTW
jgi:hypothetical protein